MALAPQRCLRQMGDRAPYKPTELAGPCAIEPLKPTVGDLGHPLAEYSETRFLSFTGLKSSTLFDRRSEGGCSRTKREFRPSDKRQSLDVFGFHGWRIVEVLIIVNPYQFTYCLTLMEKWIPTKKLQPEQTAIAWNIQS